MTTIRALRVEDGATRARVLDLSPDALSPGEVTVRVRYSSLNYKDALAVTGRGKILRRRPLNPGIDAAGLVLTSVDPRFRPNDPVLVTGCGHGEEVDGGFAELTRVRAEDLVPLPRDLSLRDAMILGTAGFTAALALERLLRNDQAPDQGPILITGASGGVGGFATQLCARAGFEVHAVSAKTELVETLKSLGAARVLSPAELDLGSRPLESVRFGGAIDNVGGPGLAQILARVAPWGNVAAIGVAAGADVPATVMPFILRGVSLLGVSSTNARPDLRRELWRRLAGPWRPAVIEGLVTRTIGLDDVPDAAELMLDRRTSGRILVDLNQT